MRNNLNYLVNQSALPNLSVEQVEQAFQILWLDSRDEELPPLTKIPPPLKYLLPQEWMMLKLMLDQLLDERENSSLQ